MGRRTSELFRGEDGPVGGEPWNAVGRIRQGWGEVMVEELVGGNLDRAWNCILRSGFGRVA